MYILVVYCAGVMLNVVIRQVFENDIKAFTAHLPVRSLFPIMKLNKALLAITASLRIGTSHAVERSAHDEEHEVLRRGFLAEQLPQRSLQLAACNAYYYTTEIGIASKQPLTCSSNEISALAATLDQLYDEVVTFDVALSHLTLETTLCTVATTATAPHRRDLRIHEDEAGDTNLDQQDHRELPIYRIRSQLTIGGTGTCRISCNPDNSDRSLMMLEEDEQSLQEERGDERNLREAYAVIDFDTDGNGNKISTTPYVKNEWYSKYGMRIRVEDANGGYAPSGKARIFNSSNPVGDRGLGTPNEKCPGGGTGVGAGGEPGKVGENCIAQGNLLIIQESNKAVADDNEDGGEISFTFDSPTRIGHIGIINLSEDSNRVELVTSDGETKVLDFTSPGKNAAQLLHVDYVVTKMTVDMESSGGISEIGIFTPTEAKQALSPKARSYIGKKSPLEEYIPYLEFDLSYYLTRRINDLYGRVSSSCLYNKWTTIDVQMEAVPSLPKKTC
jgi:hypothetical protein